jgi:hypothetical protein
VPVVLTGLHHRVVPMLERAGIAPDGQRIYFSNDLAAGVQLAAEIVQRPAPPPRHGPGHAAVHAP